MASHLNPAFRFQPDPVPARAGQYRRRKSRVRDARIQRRIKVRARHILISFAALAGLFVAFQQTWLFLISWEGLSIERVTVRCDSPRVREIADQVLAGRRYGNLLLYDIAQLRRDLESHRWIQNVRVRRVFPATLQVEAGERAPAAVLMAERPMLIDREGVRLDPAAPGNPAGLPLFMDKDHFQKNSAAKLALAWSCLDALPSGLRAEIEALDLSEYRNLTVRLKGSDTRLLLGEADFAAKLEAYLADRARLESFGSLQYVDLRFSDRIYIGLKHKRGAAPAGKEAQ
jgi:cell division septal protein FtsQ